MAAAAAAEEERGGRAEDGGELTGTARKPMVPGRETGSGGELESAPPGAEEAGRDVPSLVG